MVSSTFDKNVVRKAAPNLGFMHDAKLYTIFGAVVIRGTVKGNVLTAQVRCFDIIAVGAKKRTVHTDRGRVSVSPDMIWSFM